MKCPICGRDYEDDFVEGCKCGYNSKLLERIESLLEYYGQCMTTHASFILAIVIGLFSVINLAKRVYLPLPLAIKIDLSSIVYIILAGLGCQQIWRLKEYQFHNMALADMLHTPSYNLISKWKKDYERKRKEKKIVDFTEFLRSEKEEKKSREKLRGNKIKRSPKEKIIHLTLHSPWIYRWYVIFVLIVFFCIYNSIFPWLLRWLFAWGGIFILEFFLIFFYLIGLLR